MKRKLFLISLILLSAGVLAFFAFSRQADAPEDQTDPVATPGTTTFNPLETEVGSGDIEATLDPVAIEDKPEFDIDSAASFSFIVNKQRSVSLDYIPSPLVTPNVASTQAVQLRTVAASSLENLFAGASADGLSLRLVSGYRSSATQASLYNNYVANFGQEEADRFSARPGTSEHQLGLAADVAGPNSTCLLEICFGDSAEGQWVAQNAHKYGFVVRYPNGAEATTGYQYEPWHLRYFGVELATELFESDQVVEDYFNL